MESPICIFLSISLQVPFIFIRFLHEVMNYFELANRPGLPFPPKKRIPLKKVRNARIKLCTELTNYFFKYKSLNWILF